MSLWTALPPFPGVDKLTAKTSSGKLWECITGCPCNCKTTYPSSLAANITHRFPPPIQIYAGVITNNTPSCRGSAACNWMGNIPVTTGPGVPIYWQIEITVFLAFPPFILEPRIEFRRWETGSSSCGFGVTDGYPCCASGHYNEVIVNNQEDPRRTYVSGVWDVVVS